MNRESERVNRVRRQTQMCVLYTWALFKVKRRLCAQILKSLSVSMVYIVVTKWIYLSPFEITKLRFFFSVYMYDVCATVCEHTTHRLSIEYIQFEMQISCVLLPLPLLRDICLCVGRHIWWHTHTIVTENYGIRNIDYNPK